MITRSRRRLLGWTAALALLALPSAAAGPPDVATGLPVAPPGEVLRGTLPNGLRVVVVPNRLAPVVTTVLTYLAGSNDAPVGFPGTAHALEHMMFRGSAGLDKDQLFELGARLGGNYNASTAETVTQYTYTVAREDLPVVLQTEALRMRGLTLSQADWEQERGAINQEVSRNLSSPLYRYGAEARAILFEGTPYAQDALGTRPSFERTDAALLREFYDRWYAPNNALLVIAGDVVPAEAMASAQAAFGAIAPRTLPEHPTAAVQPIQPRTLALGTTLPVGLVTFAYRMPGLRTPDFAAADILSDVLGSQRGALFGLVTGGRALSAQFSYAPKPDVGQGLALAAFPAGSDPAPLLADLRRIIAEIVAHGVPPDLVEAAKRQEIAQLAFENDSIGGLARSWSRALAVQGLASPDEIAGAYAAVTTADVNRLAQELLRPDLAVTAILTPERDGTPVAGAGFGAAEQHGTAPDRLVSLPAWAASAAAALHLPDPVPPPDTSVLPNGLRLIVQPVPVGRTVSVFGRVRTVPPMQEPPGQEGVAALMEQLFDYGTETQDRVAFQTALDDIAARHDAGSSFELKVLTPQFEPGMRLLADSLLRPAFPAAAFANLQRQFVQRLDGQRQTPDYRAGRALADALAPPGDPARREPTVESVMALRPADVRAYYEATFRPDLTTIVVMGDVSLAEARRVVGEAFGAWQARGPAPAIDLPPAAPNPPFTARVADAGAVQDRVTLSANVGAPVTSPDREALILGNTILGGGFSSRLYRELRVKSGYVYSVSSAVDWSRTRASYTVSFGADAADVERARALVDRELRAMQTTLVSDAELTRAKAQVLRRLPMQRASVGGIASLYLRQADLGLPVGQPQAAAQRTLDMTAEQVRDAFARWLRPDDLVQVVKGPPAS